MTIKIQNVSELEMHLTAQNNFLLDDTTRII